MSFPWSFSVLGFVGGVLITFGMAIIVLYTSYVCWQFCMAYDLNSVSLIVVIPMSGMFATLVSFYSRDRKLPMNWPWLDWYWTTSSSWPFTLWLAKRCWTHFRTTRYAQSHLEQFSQSFTSFVNPRDRKANRSHTSANVGWTIDFEYHLSWYDFEPSV